MAGGEALKTSFPSHLTPRQHSKLTKLVGRKCIASCLDLGKKVNALWDTGAQVCVASKVLERSQSTKRASQGHSVELLGEDDLSLQAANGTNIAYDDWIEVEFQMAGEDGSSEPLTVPILKGSQDNQEHLIIGFNDIEEVLKRSSNSNATYYPK